MRASLLLLAACGSHPGSAIDSATGDVAAADVAADALGPVSVVGSTQLCKLFSERNTSDPTANDVQHRSNMLGADLGIPVAHGGNTFMFFGDTIGYSGIWPVGESHPDAVGVAATAADMCSNLKILSLAPAPHSDPSVVADFAGAAMAAPAGHTLGEYIRNPAGNPNGMLFPYLPGDFEVPSGAFSYGDSIYVFYTTVVSHDQPDMKASYLARWMNPDATGTPGYAIQYAIDERFDGSGALGGNFVNIAAEVAGDYVYLFGTGNYRMSPIYLARKRLDSLATPGGIEELGAIVSAAGYGETSVRYFPEISRWVLLAEEQIGPQNRILAYTAADPMGPWSAPIVVHDMADPNFRHTYCCAVDDQCEGTQMFNCDQTGFYGTYMFPTIAVNGSQFTLTYTMSSFAPYNVALFQTVVSL
jgi:hypothetical protein